MVQNYLTHIAGQYNKCDEALSRNSEQSVKKVLNENNHLPQMIY